MKTFKEKLLEYYNIDEVEFSELTRKKTIADLPNIGSFKDVNELCKAIKTSIAHDDKILIYGDYDCDGIMATSIMYLALLELNAKVSYYVPSRYIDGYGITKEKVIKAYNGGFKLIITVDNGISAFEALEEANKLGITVLICDHHEIGERLPIAKEIFHPSYSHLDISTCGGVLSFFVSVVLLNRVDEYLLCLASLSIVSDVMPVKSFNRTILSLAFEILNRNQYKTFALLSESAKYDEDVFGFKIVPKINAVGRMEEKTETNRVVRYFTTKNDSDIVTLAAYLNSINNIRKDYTQEISQNIDLSDCKDAAITLLLDVKEGMAGLLANKILTIKNKPTLIFTLSHKIEDTCVGSIRSKSGFNVIEFLKKNEDVLLAYGGHAQAGGLTIKKENFDTLKKRFNDFALVNPFNDEIHKTLDIDINDINKETYNLIRLLSPYGSEFNKPLLSINNFPFEKLKYLKGDIHIFIPIGINCKILGFNFSKNNYCSGDELKLIGILRENTFRNQDYIEFFISAINVNC